MTECASSYRNNVSAKIISITGSCGKTTLKEMISSVMKKFQKYLILQNHIIINLSSIILTKFKTRR